MVAFRRVVTALAVLALFTGFAVAQVNTTNQTLTCSTNVTVTPALRAEGYTEQTGDITIVCSGGADPVVGNAVPLVNITVFYNTNVTSRLLTGSVSSTAPNPNEALLLIDEPGATGLSGQGPQRPQKLCTTPLTGCPATVGNVPNIPAASGTTVGALDATSGLYAANVYQGTTAGTTSNAVTFFGVPALAPGTTGSRVFRITNVRVNAQPLSNGVAVSGTPVTASISISGATSLLISNSNPNVGYVSTSLSTSASSSSFNQCISQTRAGSSILTFTENFGTAFKTRVNPGVGAYSAQGTTIAQNIPGTIYNSESNFVFPIGTYTAGLADFGTRLKATFNNIPTGAHIWVSTNNIGNINTVATVPTVIGGANSPQPSYAALVSTGSTDSISDGSSFPAIANTDNATTAIGIAEVPITNGTGSAEWEVLNTNPNTNESFKFGVYITYASNVASNVPLPGQSTVNLSYGPTATSGVASNSLAIPRFVSGTTAANIFLIQVCRTILLYPYITNQVGFDTGLTVANTTVDPLNLKADGTTGYQGSNATGAQAGSCTFSFYGGTTAAPTTPPASYNTGNIAAGSVWAQTLQTVAPGFQGYAFAVCNFQFAHGFAFISDVGARNLAMGYLALVIPDIGGRDPSPFGNGAGSGEQEAH
jgi:hypothetical protein